jgi:hypothetical protein
LYISSNYPKTYDAIAYNNYNGHFKPIIYMITLVIDEKTDRDSFYPTTPAIAIVEIWYAIFPPEGPPAVGLLDNKNQDTASGNRPIHLSTRSEAKAGPFRG